MLPDLLVLLREERVGFWVWLEARGIWVKGYLAAMKTLRQLDNEGSGHQVRMLEESLRRRSRSITMIHRQEEIHLISRRKEGGGAILTVKLEIWKTGMVSSLESTTFT